MKHSRKKGLIPLLLIFFILLGGCQAPSAQSSFSSSSQEISSVDESNDTQSSMEESSFEQSSPEDSSPEDSSIEDSSPEDSSDEQSSSQAHEHSPLPDDGDCTTPIVCSCEHVMVAGEQAHRFDNACDAACNNENCAHVRKVDGHKDANDDGECDYCSTEMPKDGSFELPEDKFH